MSILPDENDAEQGATGPHPPTPILRLIPPDQIRPNPENPRLIFTPDEIEQLSDSIRQIGIQVPLTVYEDQADPEQPYVLLDGERRWRAAVRIDLERVPASVVAPPDDTTNAIRMFNIHMLRQAWKEMPTAWALEKLMKEIGVESPAQLHRLTGLGVDRIRNIQIVLRYPREVQEMVFREEIAFNALVELWKATRVLRKVPERLPFSAEEVQDEFIQRTLSSQEADPIQFRNLGRLITAALDEGVTGEAASEALGALMNDRGVSIAEAYEMGAASSFELSKVLRDLERLPQRLRRVFRIGLLPEQRNALVGAMTQLAQELGEIVEEAGDAPS
jgi:ParB family chromosome partitioning protein